MPAGTTLLTEPAVRKVFFSFHYGPDIARATVVRQSWRIRAESETKPFVDKSLWESTKLRGAAALRTLIDEGLQGTSVTCILAGCETWRRRWVRYEIAKSLSRGNGLLTVHIDGVRCMNAGLGQRGPNPLDYLACSVNESGQALIWELNAVGQWIRYQDLLKPIRWPCWLAKPPSGYVQRLSSGAAAYDYARQDGFTNLRHWTQQAAANARR